MGLINVTDNRTGMLTINGESLHTYAWDVLNCLPLWLPQAYRAGNIVLPGSAGKRARRYRIDEAKFSLPMVIEGSAAPDGTPYDDPWVGLVVNMGILNAAVCVPPEDPFDYPNAALDMPDGSTWFADVQVLGIQIGDNINTQTKATLELVIPSGGFAPTIS
jgi:hypothetical protein